MLYSRQTQKHIAIRKILDEYIVKNCGYTTCMTSWYYQVKAFREDKFASVIYGNDASLDRIVREFCDTLTACYSFTDGSTLKKMLLSILDSDSVNELKRTPSFSAIAK